MTAAFIFYWLVCYVFAVYRLPMFVRVLWHGRTCHSERFGWRAGFLHIGIGKRKFELPLYVTRWQCGCGYPEDA